jgi:hypothetical protein
MQSTCCCMMYTLPRVYHHTVSDAVVALLTLHASTAYSCCMLHLILVLLMIQTYAASDITTAVHYINYCTYSTKPGSKRSKLVATQTWALVLNLIKLWKKCKETMLRYDNAKHTHTHFILSGCYEYTQL